MTASAEGRVKEMAAEIIVLIICLPIIIAGFIIKQKASEKEAKLAGTGLAIQGLVFLMTAILVICVNNESPFALTVALVLIAVILFFTVYVQVIMHT